MFLSWVLREINILPVVKCLEKLILILTELKRNADSK